jgi:hypothetical protein
MLLIPPTTIFVDTYIHVLAIPVGALGCFLLVYIYSFSNDISIPIPSTEFLLAYLPTQRPSPSTIIQVSATIAPSLPCPQQHPHSLHPLSQIRSRTPEDNNSDPNQVYVVIHVRYNNPHDSCILTNRATSGRVSGGPKTWGSLESFIFPSVTGPVDGMRER